MKIIIPHQLMKYMRQLVQNLSCITTFVFLLCSCEKLEGGKDFVLTGDVDNLSPVSATINCSVLSKDWTGATEFGILIDIYPDLLIETSHVIVPQQQPSSGKYSVGVSGLSPGCQYYYRAFAKEGDIIHYGKEKSFETPSKNIFVSSEVTSIASVAADITTTLDLEGMEYNKAKFGVIYATEDVWASFFPERNQRKVFSSAVQGHTYTTTLIGLTPGIKYYYKPYVEIDGVIFSGNKEGFFTLNYNVVETGVPDEIGHDSAMLHGVVNLKDISFQTCNAYFELDTSRYASWGNYSIVLPATMDKDGNLYAKCTNLKPDMEYGYRAVVMINQYTFRGENAYFRTLTSSEE